MLRFIKTKNILIVLIFSIITFLLYTFSRGFLTNKPVIKDVVENKNYFPVNLQGHQFQNPFKEGFESLGFYLFTKDDELLCVQLSFGHLGFYNQLELSYLIIPSATKSPSNTFKSISCPIKSFKVENNGLKVITDCLDIETILDEDTGKSKKLVKFKELSLITGSFEFNSVDSGIQTWNEDGIVHIGEDEGSRNYIKKNYIVSNNVKGRVIISDREIDLTGDGIQGLMKTGVIPNLIYKKLNFVVFKSKTKKLVLFHLMSNNDDTSENEDSRVGYCFLYNGNDLEFVTTDYNLTLEEYSDEESGHSIIKNAHLKVRNNRNDQDYSLVLEDIEPIFKICILDVLPTMLKKIVQALITNPYIFTYYQPSKLVIKWNGGNINDEGVSLIYSNYL
ncbi:hypothetical protein CONCODRAFT_87682 [Conidiobolus coronatus NRRL 28638]|uniref:Uncharacterized protein n=1 Tax=Conidiobolus coronatus (strain ATCC 28846 / CBS 209.66 / NRRL 28638) TaxID=796925 RepID=A0A137NT06_CONC2|nr:hypothetical protein CONCODRAFT_87682 [Conidiobolus coronatus NRRL 28638]|eukprot:KXN65860.1 hypothetical protein CONCODRAFT_87682 [Conidiobolus coronatus NRRL 28638]